MAFRPYVSRQLTIALDQYLQILRYVWDMTLTTIHCTGSLWRLKNACPACTYTLQGEPELRFSLLYTMDGNDSLKHAVGQAEDADETDETDEASTQCPGKHEELLPGQVLTCDWYLTREEVDMFAKDRQVDVDMLTEVWMTLFDIGNTHSLMQGNEDNPCASRWKNMKDQHTARMWSVFDERGIFMVVCRHGFSLVIADMVRSSER